MFLILEDIKSNFKGKVYAYKGEMLEQVITERGHGEVLILQGKKERFPCHISKVKEV